MSIRLHSIPNEIVPFPILSRRYQEKLYFYVTNMYRWTFLKQIKVIVWKTSGKVWLRGINQDNHVVVLPSIHVWNYEYGPSIGDAGHEDLQRMINVEYRK